jgi:hypothetical protein
MKTGLLLISMAMIAAAQQAVTPKTARIEGRVVSTTGEAVPRATVRLGNLRPVAADDQGRFVFDNVEPSTYLLGADRPGFLRAVYGARIGVPGGVPVVLRAGQVWSDVVLALAPQVVISGRITNGTGDPLVGVRVSAAQWRYSNLGQRGLFAIGGT